MPTPASEASTSFPAPKAFAGGLEPCPKDAAPGESCAAAPAASPAPTPAPAVDESTIWKVPVTGDDPMRGPANALVTLVVFSDFECPFCKKETAVYERILSELPADVRLVWKDCPLTMHVYAEPAAELARSARSRGGDPAFWRAHDLLYAAQDQLGDAGFKKIATALDIPWAIAGAAIRGARYGAVIRGDLALSDRVDVEATPTTFVNGKKIVGAQPYERIKSVVDAELDAARRMSATVPRGELYLRIVATGKEVPVPNDTGAPAKTGP